jgi:hypothetical protein
MSLTTDSPTCSRSMHKTRMSSKCFPAKETEAVEYDSALKMLGFIVTYIGPFPETIFVTQRFNSCRFRSGLNCRYIYRVDQHPFIHLRIATFVDELSKLHAPLGGQCAQCSFKFVKFRQLKSEIYNDWTYEPDSLIVVIGWICYCVLRRDCKPKSDVQHYIARIVQYMWCKMI